MCTPYHPLGVPRGHRQCADDLPALLYSYRYGTCSFQCLSWTVMPKYLATRRAIRSHISTIVMQFLQTKCGGGWWPEM